METRHQGHSGFPKEKLLLSCIEVYWGSKSVKEMIQEGTLIRAFISADVSASSITWGGGGGGGGA